MAEFGLSVVRYRLGFRAETPVQFPAYAGSTWRGAFGHALRRAVCITREPECGGCLLRRSCVYSEVFETPAGQGPLLGKVSAAPHPYVLRPLATSGARYAVGDRLELGLNLLGRAVGHLPYLLHAFAQLGGRGVGKGDGRFGLLALEQEATLGQGDWRVVYAPGGVLEPLPVGLPVIPPCPGSVRVVLRTPYRGVKDGRVVRGAGFAVQPFLATLLRRVSLLSAYHAGVKIELDFRALSALAAGLEPSGLAVRWYDWERYSNRQHSKVPMGGLVGSFVLSGAGLGPFWPWLWLGQWVHVGKGAVMGMGEYGLEALG